MKIEFKPVRKRIELKEYASELEGGAIDVQVNVSRDVMARMLAVTTETPDHEFMTLLQELWGAEAWPVEDIQALQKHCREHDPLLWKWITQRTWELVLEYQGFVKKN